MNLIKSMTYDEAKELVIKSYGVGRKGGFDICRAILGALGNPQDDLKIIHVAGTNGKGSTCAFLQSALMAAGYKTAMFTSPHLIRFNERFNINGREISDEDFAEAVSAVYGAFHGLYGIKLYETEGISISYFELLTLMAFKYFSDKAAEAAVIEVGLGGRLDATNVIERPLLTVLTQVSLDHTEILGDTVEDIAKEKLGIVKENAPLYVFAGQEKILGIAESVCRSKNAPLHYQADLGLKIHSQNLDGIEYSCNHLSGVKISLPGKYQAVNSANAIAVLRLLNTLGLAVSEENIRRGLANTKWPGRMEVLSKEPLVIADGAHNPEGAAAAANFIRTYLKDKNVVLLLGILNDKDADGIVKPLAGAAAKVVLTQPGYSQKAVPPHVLSRALPEAEKCAGVFDDYNEALKAALALAGKDGAVFVTGSLYLVGDIRACSH